MKYGLKKNTINKIVEVISSFPQVREAILFGSRAKGNYKTGSDIDVVLKGEELKITTLNKISLKLDDLMLPYFIVLSIYHYIENKELLKHINVWVLSFMRVRK